MCRCWRLQYDVGKVRPVTTRSQKHPQARTNTHPHTADQSQCGVERASRQSPVWQNNQRQGTPPLPNESFFSPLVGLPSSFKMHFAVGFCFARAVIQKVCCRNCVVLCPFGLGGRYTNRPHPSLLTATSAPKCPLWCGPNFCACQLGHSRPLTLALALVSFPLGPFPPTSLFVFLSCFPTSFPNIYFRFRYIQPQRGDFTDDCDRAPISSHIVSPTASPSCHTAIVPTPNRTCGTTRPGKARAHKHFTTMCEDEAGGPRTPTATVAAADPGAPNHPPSTSGSVIEAASQPGDEDEFDLVEGYETSNSLASTSATSSIYAHTFENGRRYHYFKNSRYPLPDDDMEQSREDMKHAMMMELTDGKLFYAPVGDNPQEILDIGTGTGTSSRQATRSQCVL
jgi:hypothetical protein